MIIMLDEELTENKEDKSFLRRISDFLENIDPKDFSDNAEPENRRKKSEIKDQKTEFSLKSLLLSF